MPEQPRSTAWTSSSALLTEIMQRPLDPGYAVAARRRAEGGAPPRRPRPRTPRQLLGTVRRSVTVVALLGLLLGLVAGAGVAQLRRQPLEASDRAVLESEVQRRTEVADELAASNEVLRQQIEADQAEALGERAASLLAAADRLALVTGAVPVTGVGVRVVLDDAAPAVVGGEVDEDGRVRDADIQTVVNGLWEAGAEGVSVNGQRLTTLSTIRHAGDAVVIDLRQLARPYEIDAIGDPDPLLREVRTGRAGQYTAFLRNSYGIEVSVAATSDQRLPAASRLTLRHARGVTGTDGSTDVGPQQPEVEP